MTDIRTAAEALEDDAMPRSHAVKAEPEAPMASAPPLPQGAQKARSPAEWAYQRMILYIKKFEEGLDEDQEVAMAFAGDETGVIRIMGMGFFDPDIITFYGQDASGARTQLVQHVTQLSIRLRALPKPAAAAAPRRIGFRLAADLDAEDTAPE
ncbi:hypothetical protein [Palleronia sp. LCG004]|uniref:hypothetical protein n=1 Tax=Palleronia sp. LCG004 TaxID=3079304 RepID=UPI0029432275|nr:hypothetical protein [Palleronia sp. LCG004]WOI55418.1 hypothetical protein RVY76_10215 [Palleronia sp. LCG004]